MEDFVTPEGLLGLPGSTFPAPAVAAAVARIRREAGWHIAPSVTETIDIDSWGGNELVLPSLYVTDVASVAIWGPSGLGPSLALGEEVRWSQRGLLWLPRGGTWPVGRGKVQVTLTHGYPEAPADLKLLTASATTRPIASESISSRAVTFADNGNQYGAQSILDSYRLAPRP